jgi:uncharacterized membrane protein YfcA
MEAVVGILIGLVFLAAGAVKGLSGMGLPTFSMALLGLFMPPAAAATLMVLPSLATNVSQCIGPHAWSLARRIWPMWLALIAATIFSPFAGLGGSGESARVLLGGVLIVYGAWGLTRPALPDMRDRPLLAGAVAGALSGMLAASTGVFVMPLVPFLQTQRLSSGEMIQALGLTFMLATLALAIRLGHTGVATTSATTLDLAIAIGTAFVGLFIGTAFRNRMQPAVFQRALYTVFCLLGAVMVVRSLLIGTV